MHQYKTGDVAWLESLQQPFIVCGINGEHCDEMILIDGQVEFYDCPIEDLEPTDQYVELDQPGSGAAERVDRAVEELAQIRAACAAVIAQRQTSTPQ